MGLWDILADIFKNKHSEAVDKKANTIIVTDNKNNTVFIDKTKEGNVKISSAPFKKPTGKH